MKKALLLVLVLAFMLVPVFSSAVSADSADAWNIGAGYDIGGTLTPAELEATENGLVFTQKGYFFPGWAGGHGWGDGLGVVAKDLVDQYEITEISLTLSLDEYDNKNVDDQGVLQADKDGWFKYTLMNGPHSINFEAADEGLQGLTVSFCQNYESWGQESPRFRVWIEQLLATDPDGDGTFAQEFKGFDAAQEAVWAGEHLGEDVTLKIVKNEVSGRFQISAELGGDEQIIATGLNLLGLWGEDADGVYAGFCSALDRDSAVKATIKYYNGEWLGTGEDPNAAPDDEPTDAPATDAPATDAPATEAPEVIPPTGQDFSVAIILGSMAAMLAIAGAAVMVNKSRA